MKNLVKAGRAFYAIGIAGIGIQQFIYADFDQYFYRNGHRIPGLVYVHTWQAQL